MDERREIPADARAVANDLPWNSRFLGVFLLIQHEERDHHQTDDERCEHLCGGPGEADASECQTYDGKRGA